MDTYTLTITPTHNGAVDKFQAELMLTEPTLDFTVLGFGYGETAAEAAINAVAETVSDPGLHYNAAQEK